jgi:hypothetical protein
LIWRAAPESISSKSLFFRFLTTLPRLSRTITETDTASMPDLKVGVGCCAASGRTVS